jgi:sugar fermentation stimulation protein A
MLFPPLIEGRLLRRYKRFLADVEFADGNIHTVHCPNPGSMMGLKEPGSKVWISDSANPKRKLRYTLELLEADGTLVAINTMNPNKIAREAIEGGLVSGLKNFSALQSEVRYGENSRVDFLATTSPDRKCWIEVKNCHLVRGNNLYEFPDSVTSRGAKHLRDLSAKIQEGDDAILLFIIQRADGDRLSLAADLDPAYAREHIKATAMGVKTVCLRCDVSLEGVTPRDEVPFIPADV